jgi:hypothetical protein
MMADTEGRENQDRLAIPQLDAEYHAELAIRGRESQLHAMLEGGSIRPLLLTSKKVLNRHPSRFKFFASRKRHLLPGVTCTLQILGKGSVIEQRRRSA